MSALTQCPIGEKMLVFTRLSISYNHYSNNHCIDNNDNNTSNITDSYNHGIDDNDNKGVFFQ